MGDFWYPFYPSRFKSATRHLTAEQDGIYRRLIDEYMETREPLPDNDIALARIAGVNKNKWLDAARIIRAYFTHKNGMLYHDYCDQMLDIQDKKAQRRSASAEKAAKKRWSKVKQNQEVTCATHNERNAIAMRSDATDTDTVTVTDIRDSNLTLRSMTFLAKDGRFFNWSQIVDLLWSDYPKVGRANRGKKQFEDELEKYLKKVGKNETDWTVSIKFIAERIRDYRKYCESTGEKQCDPHRWLRNKGFDDEYSYKPIEGGRSVQSKGGGKGNPTNALNLALSDQSRRSSSD